LRNRGAEWVGNSHVRFWRRVVVVTQRLSLIPTVIVVFSTGLNPDQKYSKVKLTFRRMSEFSRESNTIDALTTQCDSCMPLKFVYYVRDLSSLVAMWSISSDILCEKNNRIFKNSRKSQIVKMGRTRDIYAEHKIVFLNKQRKGARLKILDRHGTQG
jgi:hypothetical protein